MRATGQATDLTKPSMSRCSRIALSSSDLVELSEILRVWRRSPPSTPSRNRSIRNRTDTRRRALRIISTGKTPWRTRFRTVQISTKSLSMHRWRCTSRSVWIRDSSHYSKSSKIIISQQGRLTKISPNQTSILNLSKLCKRSKSRIKEQENRGFRQWALWFPKFDHWS